MNVKRQAALFLLFTLVGALAGASVGVWMTSNRDGAVADALSALAWKAIEEKRMNEVASYAFGALEKDAESHSPYLILGELYALRGERLAALEMYNRSLEKLRANRGHSFMRGLDKRARESEAAAIGRRVSALADNPQS